MTTLRSNDPCWCGSGKKLKRCHKAAAGPARPVKPGRISPIRSVPEAIVRPEYAESGIPSARHGRAVQPPDVVERMRHAGAVAAEVLLRVGAAVAPGVTTEELDAIGHEAFVELGAYPSTLNYRGFPKSLCTSINEVICHGIPDDRPLEDGDIVNIDVTGFVDGVHGDTSAMYLVGEVDDASRRLVQVTREAMEMGIEAVRPGARVNDIGRAIEQHAAAHGYGVVRAFIGHGIGEQFHTSLQIPHYFDARADTVLEPGMTFTIEPMLTMGTWRHVLWDDGWTAVTEDGRRSAQWEHTVAVTDTGVELLTVTSDGRSASELASADRGAGAR